MTDKLLPCPFCGGEASDCGEVRYDEKFAKREGWTQSTFYYCNCVGCGADNKGLVGHRTKLEAIEAWNRRTPSPQNIVMGGDAPRRYDLTTVHRAGQQPRGEMLETVEGEYVAYDDFARAKVQVSQYAYERDLARRERDEATSTAPVELAMGSDDLRKRVMRAIFDPGATEGFKGDRDLTTWQTDAVMHALAPAETGE